MKGVGICVALLTLLVVVNEAKYYKSSNYYSKCAMYHNGCEYQVTLSPGNCGYSSDSTGFTIVKSHEISSKTKNYASNTVNTKTNSDKLEMEKLDHLERKLSKMLEGLSIRSLRHIRGIRKELSQMANSISLLQHSAPSKNGRSVYNHPGGLGQMQYACPAEFVRVGTWPSCYRFSNFNATWSEAREYCAAFGANLVALDTLKESYIMDYIIKSNSEYDNPKGWWTSGNYVVRARKWMWTSIHHLKPITYSRWAKGEPNARSTMHCMLLYREAGYRWHDGYCTDQHNFICEIDLLDVK